jgi:hypothetical protein
VLKDTITTSCIELEMFHLVKDNVDKIENNLLWVKQVRDSMFSWWFNVVLLIGVVGSFGYFLYSSYGTAPSEEMKQIPFEPRMWNNAVRNVPISDYGQTPQIEAGDSIQGFTHRTSAGTI